MHTVIIHKYTDLLTAIEFGAESDVPENFLVFVGGLTDGFLTVPYVPQLASGVRENLGSKWVVVQALISSSYLGFGTGSLRRDAEEIGQLVKYLRTKRGKESAKVVLMGHSTGCQDTMEYLTKYSREEGFEKIQEINGGILQAPVSDSEAFEFWSKGEDLKTLKELISLAKTYLDAGKPNELLPKAALDLALGTAFTAYRFHSLATRRGDDDYFSSYLDDEDYAKTFAVVQKPLLILYSEADEHVPLYVNKKELVEKWKKAAHPAVWSKHSKLVPGALHNVGPGSAEGAVDDVVETVIKFIKDL